LFLFVFVYLANHLRACPHLLNHVRSHTLEYIVEDIPELRVCLRNGLPLQVALDVGNRSENLVLVILRHLLPANLSSPLICGRHSVSVIRRIHFNQHVNRIHERDEQALLRESINRPKCRPREDLLDERHFSRNTTHYHGLLKSVFPNFKTN
jgi:hypothetical protein